MHEGSHLVWLKVFDDFFFFDLDLASLSFVLDLALRLGPDLISDLTMAALTTAAT